MENENDVEMLTDRSILHVMTSEEYRFRIKKPIKLSVMRVEDLFCVMAYAFPIAGYGFSPDEAEDAFINAFGLQWAILITNDRPLSEPEPTIFAMFRNQLIAHVEELKPPAPREDADADTSTDAPEPERPAVISEGDEPDTWAEETLGAEIDEIKNDEDDEIKNDEDDEIKNDEDDEPEDEIYPLIEHPDDPEIPGI